MTETNLRVDKIIEEYLSKGDLASENANMSFGPSGVLFVVGGEGLKKDYLSRMKEAGHRFLPEWHNSGKIHIHDLSLGFNVPYCAGHSLLNLMSDGITTSSVKSSPAKHFSSIINHMVNYIGASANDFAGAQAFNDIDLYLGAYAYKTYLDYKKIGCAQNIAFQLTRKLVYQEIQSFIFHMNYNTRWGGQAPFSNISLSITVPDDMKHQLALVGGKPIAEYFDYMKDGIQVKNHTYWDLREWQQLVVDAILDVYIDGDSEGKSFTFPILTINVTDDFFVQKNHDKICKLSNKFGTPFFQNYINGYGGGKKLSPSDTRSMCCFSGNEVIEVLNKKTNIKEIYKIKDFVNLFVNENENDIKKIIDKNYTIISFDGKDTSDVFIIGILKKRNLTGKLIEIKTDNKKIKVTPDHEFMVKNKMSGEIEKVNADFLTKNKEKYLLPVFI